MIAKDKPEVAHMVDDHNYDAIQREITDMTVGVKAHVFVNVFKQQEGTMISENGEMLFNIDIGKLKAVLESDKKGKRVLSDKLETLMPMMRENKVRSDALTSIRHSARAVAASA
jgi:nucleoside 2-deoxyribosyltransferase